MQYLANDFLRCWPWLAKALDLTGGTHTQRDILDGTLDGSFQLWPSENAAALTEIVSYPQMKTVRIFLAGGDLNELKETHEKIERWALKTIGARRLEICGRDGWLRALDGYKKICTTVAKELKDE